MAILEADSRSKQRGRNYRITKFFIEPGISGTRTDRKEFLALKKAIRQGDFAFVTFKEISRIARDSQIWKEFFKLCQSKGCEIVLRGLPIDPNDPGQILQLDILAIFAEYEAKVTAKRIRESVHSAMVNNGKFNSTHRVLGLSPLIINGQQRVGFYQANEEELTTVRWIMEQFIKYGSHQKVIELCNERGIKNWNGQLFQRHSLINLLTNPRYIGKWYLNTENKTMDEESLPEHKRFKEIDLPLGPVIPLKLWREVQAVVKKVAGNLGKNTRISRVYPLSGGLLRYHDGSVFRGCSGTGKTAKSYYYFNEKNGLRIPCEIVERDAITTVTKIIQNSPELQSAIRASAEDAQDKLQFHNQQIKDLKRNLEHVNQQKKQYLQKMNLLVTDDSSDDEIKLFRDEFKSLLKSVNEEKASIEERISRTEQEIRDLKGTTFTWAEIEKHARSIQEILLTNDPIALKRAYYGLFKGIIISPEDDLGARKLIYILKNNDELLEDEVRLTSEMVEVAGIEPASEVSLHRRSTRLVCDFSYSGGDHKQPTPERSLLKFRIVPACQQHEPIP